MDPNKPSLIAQITAQPIYKESDNVQSTKIKCLSDNKNKYDYHFEKLQETCSTMARQMAKLQAELRPKK